MLKLNKWFFIGILLLLWCIFFNRILFFGENLYCCDNFLINLPSKLFLIDQLKLGHLPLWNPYLFSGTPFLADINLGLLYPGNFLFFLLPPFRALTIGVVSQVLIGLIGMYWYCRTLKVSNIGALAASIIFGFSGTMVTYTNNVPMMQVAALLPWLFGCWVLYIEKPTARHMVLVCLISGLQIIAGHPQLTFYSFLFCYFYALVFFPGSFFYRVKKIVPVGFITLLLGSVQLLPFIEFAKYSTRLGQGINYASFGALPLTAIIRLILPTIVGDARIGTDWWQGGSMYGYIGFVSVLIIFCSIRKEKKFLFFAFIALISFFASFGTKMPIFYLLYYLVPGMSLFRVPSQLLLITTFSCAYLVGEGIDYLDGRGLIKNKRLFWGPLVLGITGGILFLGSKHIVQWIFSNSFLAAHLANKLALVSIAGVQSIVSAIGINSIFIGISLCIFLVVLQKRYPYAIYLLVCVLFVDLLFYSRMNLLIVPEQQTRVWVQQTEQSSTSIASLLPADYRLYIDPSLYPSGKKQQFGKETFVGETSWQATMLRPNMATMYGIHLVDGYASLIYSPYQQFFNVPANDPTGVTIGTQLNNHLNTVSAEYILYPKNKPFDGTQYSLVSVNNSFEMLKNTNALPFVSALSEDGVRTTVPFVQSTPNDLSLSYQSSSSATLVLTQVNYPGWKATIDGKPVRITPYQKIFQSLAIQPGKHVIHLTFYPLSVIFGLLLTICGFIVCGILWFLP